MDDGTNEFSSPAINCQSRNIQVLGDRIHGSAVLNQKRNNIGVPQAGGNVQRRLILSRLSIDLCSVSQQNSYNIGLIGSSGQMEGRLPPNGGHISVGHVLNQIDDNVHAPHERGNVQWCQARLEEQEELEQTSSEDSFENSPPLWPQWKHRA